MDTMQMSVFQMSMRHHYVKLYTIGLESCLNTIYEFLSLLSVLNWFWHGTTHRRMTLVADKV